MAAVSVKRSIGSYLCIGSILFALEGLNGNTDFIFPRVISRVRYGPIFEIIRHPAAIKYTLFCILRKIQNNIAKLAIFFLFTKLLRNASSGRSFRGYEFFRLRLGKVGVVRSPLSPRVVYNHVILMLQILGILQRLHEEV